MWNGKQTDRINLEKRKNIHLVDVKYAYRLNDASDHLKETLNRADGDNHVHTQI